MTPNINTSLAEMAPLYGSVLPNRSDQVFVFLRLLDSIFFCEQQGSRAWSVTQLGDGFRLNVGQVEALTCRFTFFLADDSELDRDTSVVSFRMLLAGDDCLSKIPLPQETAGIYEMAYKSLGEKHWCYEGRFYAGIDGEKEPDRVLVETHTAALRSNHQAFLDLACHTPTGKLRQKSNFARSHSDALYEYAKSVVIGGSKKSTVVEASIANAGSPNPLVRTRIEKAAADSGYELTVTWVGDTATLRSSQFPEAIGVQYLGGQDFSVSASNTGVLTQVSSAGRLEVSGWADLYDVLGKVAATARTLPDRVAQQFIKETAQLPRSTEAERLVVQRIGQDLFRTSLLDYWHGKCCVTELTEPGLLRASHIRPWSHCETDEQRLDVFNGLLLAPHLDALFDGGWISFADDGKLLVAPSLSKAAQEAIGFSTQWAVVGLLPQHAPYLAYHRQKVWRHGA